MDASHGRSPIARHASTLVIQTQDCPTPPSSSSTVTLDCTARGRKKALLIGIRTSRTVGYRELTAAHGDVRKMRDLLISVYDYALEDICILIDDGIEGHAQPTRDNILLAITELIKDAKEGDHFFFHYCGHSTQVDNPRSNSEEDGKDECLVPLDGEDKKIVDNELHAALVRPLPAGTQLVAVLDTCHSGSLLDLPHYRCNRVPVPWTWRGKRNSDGPRNMVARRGAQLLTLRADALGRKTPTSSSRAQTRRSVISVVCEPEAPPRPLSRAPTGPTAAGPLTRLRTSVSRSRTNSFPFPPADKENVKEGAMGNVLSALSSWFLPEEDHCDSPVGKFPCNGWCRDVRGHSKDMDQSDDAVKADVVSLASCKDSQMAWELGGQSMTSSLVDILQDDPDQSFQDLLIRLSHATYSMALTRHSSAKVYKQKNKTYVWWLKRNIARLERGNKSTASLVIPDTPPAIAPSPTFPHARKKSSFVQKLSDEIAVWKMQLKEASKHGEYDTDAFQNPELASPQPLDMSRRWRM
ncbi:caspase domain-containing protein [Mycena epipterygia]|nr:caspase domain-containing protein [Mycena epipterygia]